MLPVNILVDLFNKWVLFKFATKICLAQLGIKKMIIVNLRFRLTWIAGIKKKSV